ncbi:MAG: 50S ribosomal protein L11 methyltransferase [Smithellaceae bacterium]|nr:50S ribosomal protein L11 methyltransferase [Smithellaceae bacterium]
MKNNQDRWIKIEIKAAAELIDPLSNYLTEIDAEGFYQDLPVTPADEIILDIAQQLTAYLADDDTYPSKISSLKEYIRSLAAIFPERQAALVSAESVDGLDWGEEWKKYFKPFRIGRHLVIKPSWEAYEPGNEDLMITLDPGMAFGTGQHATTRMCLEALEMLLDGRDDLETFRVLDVGTGTGILAVYAAKLGAGQVTGIDIDSVALAIARENAKSNAVGWIQFLERPIMNIQPSFDLILANLTSRPLIELRPFFQSLLAARGQLVISGILAQEREEMEAGFLLPPFNNYQVLAQEEWLCFHCRTGETK